MYRLGLVVGVLTFAALSFAFARSGEVDSEPPRSTVDRVVVFAIPNLGIDDVDASTMPVLDRLASRGAIAAANVRTKGGGPDVVEAYATLSAGNRVALSDPAPPPPTTTTTPGAPDPTDPTGGVVPGPGAPAGVERVLPTVALLPAVAVGGSDDDPEVLVVPSMVDLVAGADAGTVAEAQPGSLATALRAAGRQAALVGIGGAPTADGSATAPAGVAAADRLGFIGLGSIDSTLLTSDLTRPLGLTADPRAHARAVTEALDRASLVVVDPGETLRADTAGSAPLDGGVAEELRIEALRRTDRVLGAVEAELDRDTLLVVVGVTPPGDRWALTPMVLHGAGTRHGYLHSSSTHRPDLVTLTDVAPTVLDALGVEPPGAMIGNPLTYRPGEADWGGAQALDSLLERRAPIDRPMAVGFIVVQTLVYLLAIAVLLADPVRPRWFDHALLLAVVTCASWPLATFWLRIAPSLYSHGVGTFVLCWVVAAVVALGVTRLRRHVLDPVLALCSLTAATIVADLATGAHLQYGSFFGYAPTTAPRFIGIGNAAFALLGGATVVICTVLVARARDRSRGLWAAGAVAVVVVLADGAPWMGTDVGGILTLVPVLCLLLWSLSGRQVRWYTIGLAALAAAAVIGVVVGLESLRDPGDRTHIGRFFLQTGDTATVGDTFRRKWDANTAVLRSSPVAWIVPVVAGLAFVAVASGRAWRRLLPVGSPERTGVIATLAMGFVGWLLNDSGVVVLALGSVFLGPYILLLAQADRRAGTGARPDGGPIGEPAAGSVGSPMHEDQPVEPVTIDTGADGSSAPSPTVVALVPAFDRVDSIADTVTALSGVARIERIVVIDDGSTDGTAAAAVAAGAEVVVLPENRGKGGAVAAGVEATPEADVYLLIDADLARTAGAADLLLDPVLAGRADLVIGALPAAGGRGGFGLVRDLAARGIAKACGLQVRAPLSGQRAVRAHLLRDLESADRFGLEVAMTIDAVRAGARVLEVDVPMDHRHTGRSLRGFAHRGRQGADIVHSLWPRVTTRRQRLGLLVAGTVLVCLAAPLLGSSRVPDTEPLGGGDRRVLVFGMQPLTFDDLERGVTPNLQRLIDRGAIGALSVRTVSRRPTASEGYLSLGAGARLRSGGLDDTVIPADTPVGPTTAARYITSFTGVEPVGGHVSMGGAGMLQRNDGPEADSHPGALGDALADAGLRTAVVGNSDQPPSFTSEGYPDRSAALVTMTSDLGVTNAHIEPDDVLETSPDAPYGHQADHEAVVAAATAELVRSTVVVVDPGDLARADRFTRAALPEVGEREWERSLERTDDLLGRLVGAAPDDTLVMVVGVVPRDHAYRPTPLVIAGPGVPNGRITSPSTRQSGLSAITDLAPTILDAAGVEVPADLPGNAVRYEPGPADLDGLRGLDTDTQVREATYGPVSTRYIQAFTALYLGALVLLVGGRHRGRIAPWLRWSALALTAVPVASFLVRLVPGLTAWFTAAQAIATGLLAAGIGWLASRRRRAPLSSLAWVAGLTIAVIVVDAWTGTRLHVSSWLGYSVHNAGRFYGVPNTTFAVLGGLTLVWAAIVVHQARRREEAVWLTGAVFVVVLLSAGLPMLGADVGSLVTLVPVFAVTLLALSGRRPRIRTLVVAGLAMVVVVAVAAGLDLSRPADQRSHLGQFAESVLDDGLTAFSDTFARKQAANLRLLGVSQWTRIVPVALVFLAVPLLWQRRLRELLPPASALRVGFVAVLGATVLGFASNDSGPIVIALFLAQLPPFLLLRIQAVEAPRPHLLAADGASPTPLASATGASARAR
jgi:hypothetical protein